MIGKGEEIIGPSFVFFSHLTVSFHILAEYLNQFLAGMADLSKPHGIVVEGSFLVVLGNIPVVEIYHRLAHVGEIKLNAGKIRYHQGSFAENFFVAHIPCGGNDFHEFIFRKILCLGADNGMQDVLNPVAVLFRRV